MTLPTIAGSEHNLTLTTTPYESPNFLTPDRADGHAASTPHADVQHWRRQALHVHGKLRRRFHHILDSLKQLTSLSSGGGLNLSYSYPTTGYNGKIQSQTDALSGETVTYTYDSLNRLATAENQTGFSPSWGQSFAYDGFGNLTGTSVIKGSAPTMAATYDVNNHAGGEDANGNPGYVPAPAQVTGASAVHDVENRLGTVSEGYTLLIFYSYAPGNKRASGAATAGATSDEVHLL